MQKAHIRALLWAAVLGISSLLSTASHAIDLNSLSPNTVVGRLGAGVPGPAQAIPFLTLGAQLGNAVISVRALGAKCDGVTDDTAAFNAAAVQANNASLQNSSATIQAVGQCVISNITWPASPFNNVIKVQLDGTLYVKDPKGLNWPGYLTYEGVSGGNIGNPFQIAASATIRSIAGNNATGTGTGSAQNITLSGTSGTWVIGGTIVGTGVPSGTVLMSQTSGTTGKDGVYATNHTITSSGASITEGPITIHGTNSDNALLNISVNFMDGGVGVLFDGITTPGAADYNLNNVNAFADGNGTGTPLVVAGIENIVIRDSQFIGLSVSGPSIAFVSSNGLEPNSYVHIEGMWTDGHGIEVSGPNCLEIADIKNWVYEAGNDDPIILSGTCGLSRVLFEKVEFADNIAIDAFINNSVGGCSNVRFVNPSFVEIPVVKNLYPLCGVDIDGWQSFGGISDILHVAGQYMYFLRQNGVYDGISLARGARFGPSAVPYTPLNVPQNPASWSANSGNVTITTGITGPDGSTNAAKIVSSSGGGIGTTVFTATDSSLSLSVGGWIVAGFWSRCDGSAVLPNTSGNNISFSTSSSTFTNGQQLFNIQADESVIQTCSWKPSVSAAKIAALHTGDSISFFLSVDPTHTTDYFMPWAIYVPPSTLPDDEVLRWARQFSTVVSTAPAGSAASYQPLYLSSPTATASNPLLDIEQTWNNGAATFTGAKINITNTASAAASKILDLQVGTNPVFSAFPTGEFRFNTSSSLDGIRINDGGTSGLIGNYAAGGFGAGKLKFAVGTSELATNAGLAVETSGTLEQLASTTAQSFHVYNTTDSNTSPANYERGVMDWITTSNVLRIGTEALGSGSTRNMEFVIGGTNKLDYGVTNSGAWTSAVNIVVPQKILNTGISTDSGQTATATVCEDTTTHQFYFGSGTGGICKGTSSMRFKHDIAPLTDGIDQIMAMQPVRYYANAGYGDPNKPLNGLLAEDMEHVSKVITEHDGHGDPISVDYVGIIPVLINAIKQQQAEIEALKARH